jgi:molecular chaperone GrpE (heat shock protein)
MKNIEEEYKAYDTQTEKFQEILRNIKENKENFYPPESKHLFKDYIEVIDILKKNLKTMETDITKNNPKN